MKRKRIHKIVVIVLIIFFFIIFALYFIPIRFSVQSIESAQSEKFFIAYRISAGSTEAGCWVCIGDQDGMFENSLSVSVQGELPENELSRNICDTNTKYILYGKMDQKLDPVWGYTYTIICSGWDLFDDVKRCDNLIRINFDHYITVYDLKWFDFPYRLLNGLSY